MVFRREGDKAERTASDPELLERARTGDKAAWDRLIPMHSPVLRRSLRRWMLPEERVDDLMQAAWLRLFERSREGRLSQLLLPALVLTTAHRMALDQWRRQLIRQADPLDEGQVKGDTVSAERLVLSRDHLGKVGKALEARFSPLHLEIFLRVLSEGESAAEVGQALDRSEQRVRQIVYEVRQFLRQQEALGGAA